MPNIKLGPGGCHITPEGDEGVHLGNVALDLGVLGCDNLFADVAIHCKNKVTFKINKLVLAQSSKLLQPIFASACDCPSFTGVTYDIFCLDFHPMAMSKVLELIFSGKTSINPDNQIINTEIRAILKELQVNIFLPETQSRGYKDLPIEITLDDEDDQDEIETEEIEQTFNQDLMCEYCDKPFTNPVDLKHHVEDHFNKAKGQVEDDETDSDCKRVDIKNDSEIEIDEHELEESDRESTDKETESDDDSTKMESDNKGYEKETEAENKVTVNYNQCVEKITEHKSVYKKCDENEMNVSCTDSSSSSIKEQSTLCDLSKHDSGINEQTSDEDEQGNSNQGMNCMNLVIPQRKNFVDDMNTNQIMNFANSMNTNQYMNLNTNQEMNLDNSLNTNQEIILDNILKNNQDMDSLDGMNTNQSINNVNSMNTNQDVSLIKMNTSMADSKNINMTQGFYNSNSMDTISSNVEHQNDVEKIYELVQEKESILEVGDAEDSEEETDAEDISSPIGLINSPLNTNQQDSTSSTTYKFDSTGTTDDNLSNEDLTEADSRSDIDTPEENNAKYKPKRKYKHSTGLSCYICHKTQKTQVALTSHLALDHFRIKLLQIYVKNRNLCRVCKKEFNNQNVLLRHIANKHNGLNTFIAVNPKPDTMPVNFSIPFVNENLQNSDTNSTFENSVINNQMLEFQAAYSNTDASFNNDSTFNSTNNDLTISFNVKQGSGEPMEDSLSQYQQLPLNGKKKSPKVKPEVVTCTKCNGRISGILKRKMRCRTCSACRRTNCGSCKACLNPSMKKACLLKECKAPVLPKCKCVVVY